MRGYRIHPFTILFYIKAGASYMTEKIAPVDVAIHRLLAGRWSPRSMSGKLIEREQLHQVLEAARWAPSAYNMQPWRFLILDRCVDESAFQLALSTLVPFNQQWNAEVPVLICVAANTLTAKGDVNHTATYDAGAAAMCLMLQAHALGLAAHAMSGFNHDAFRDAFAIPAHVELIAIISLGHFGDPGRLADKLRERELAPRERLSLADIAYEGAWERSFARSQP